MITYLHGQVLETLEDAIWLRVQDVGYEIAVHPRQLPQILPGGTLSVYCHTMVSDSDIRLHGFLTREELLLFRRLMTVSGVGGKVAQAMVASMAPETLIHAVLAGDEKTLTRIPGVGKKMASRLIFELKDKLLKDDALSVGAGAAGQDKTAAMLAEVVEAMEALGYTRTEVYPLLVSLQEENALLERTEDNIKLLLRRLSEKKRR